MAESATTTASTTDAHRRHKSNRAADTDALDDSNKYQKRKSRSQKSSKRMSWTLFCALFAGIFLLLVGSMLSDYFHTEKRRHRMGIMKRARQMMEERQGLSVGSNNGNFKNYLVDKGHESRHASALRGEKDGIIQVAQNRVEKREEKQRDSSKGGGLMSHMFGASKEPTKAMQALRQEFIDLDHDIRENVHGGIRWCKDKLLRDLPGQKSTGGESLLDHPGKVNNRKGKTAFHDGGIDFSVHHKYDPPMAWETEWAQMTQVEQSKGPKVDYTKHDYQYQEIQDSPPQRGYPLLEPMEELMKRWPQDELDNPPFPIVERLMHFDFRDQEHQAMALKYRKAELPFKVTNVPEVVAAGIKWTDDYVASHFDGSGGGGLFHKSSIPRSKGNCQESHDNFFAFFTPMGWSFATMGPPPYRNNDWNYRTWSNHAKYADAKSLSYDQPHFYWQSGVPKTERMGPKSEWTFVSRDLPSFSSSTNEATFFQFNPSDQKGIQCRFGERGVTAATHYDAGRNMIAMMQGAKRYILSPPKECSKLGIVTVRGNTLFRHSLLNFGHITHLNSTSEEETGSKKSMPDKERAWLERSKTGLAVETVLKAGEVLYVPSHWFHYITSLQKSAQCNVRSGVDEIGTRAFGGSKEVYECVD